MSVVEAVERFTERRRLEALKDAVDFLVERYGLDAGQRQALSEVQIRWRRGGKRSTFTAPRNGGPGRITVSLPRGSLVRWHVYRRVGAGWVTPRSGLTMALPTLARLVLVHELTHALQHGTCGGPRRRYSEVETTRNEIEFLRRHQPEAMMSLVPVERRATRATSSRRSTAGVSLLDRLLGWLRGGRVTSARARRCRAAQVPRPARVG